MGHGKLRARQAFFGVGLAARSIWRVGEPAQRVSVIDVCHCPVWGKLSCHVVVLQALFELPARAEHDRVVELRLGAQRYRAPRRVPKTQVVHVVERVRARLEGLHAEEGSEQRGPEPLTTTTQELG